jgi:hypothetical protein
LLVHEYYNVLMSNSYPVRIVVRLWCSLTVIKLIGQFLGTPRSVSFSRGWSCSTVFHFTFRSLKREICLITCGSRCYWWRKPEYPEKTTDLSQVTDKLYHIMLYHSPWSRFKLTTSVVIGTDCTGSCKSNYHTITWNKL